MRGDGSSKGTDSSSDDDARSMTSAARLSARSSGLRATAGSGCCTGGVGRAPPAVAALVTPCSLSHCSRFAAASSLLRSRSTTATTAVVGVADGKLGGTALGVTTVAGERGPATAAAAMGEADGVGKGRGGEACGRGCAAVGGADGRAVGKNERGSGNGRWAGGSGRGGATVTRTGGCGCAGIGGGGLDCGGCAAADAAGGNGR